MRIREKSMGTTESPHPTSMKGNTMATSKEKGIIFQDAQGRWTVAIELAKRDGKRRRKVVRVKSKTEANRTLAALLQEHETHGDLQTKVLTVEQWLNEWFETIASQKIRPKTAATYRGIMDREIIKLIGSIKLNKLTPTDVRNMNKAIAAKGLTSTAAQAYRILSVALKYAEQEGHVARNVARMVDPPRRTKPQLTVLTVEEAKRVMRTVEGTPLESLWYAVLLTGARQGELLGLEIDRVSPHVIEISWQMQRLSWEHGCGGTCNRTRGSDCRKRKITAPLDWESRHLTGGLWLARPKSENGRRIVPLIPILRASIAQHLRTCDYPNPHGLVWRMPDGSPIDPRWENEEWHEVLVRAGIETVDPETGKIIKRIRLHDARHTSVDLLYESGMPEDVIQEIVGHSTVTMSRSYKSAGNQKRLISAMMQLAELMDRGAPAIEQ